MLSSIGFCIYSLIYSIIDVYSMLDRDRDFIRPSNLYQTEYIVLTWLIQNKSLYLLSLIGLISVINLVTVSRGGLKMHWNSTQTHMIFIHKAFRYCFQTFFLKKASLYTFQELMSLKKFRYKFDHFKYIAIMYATKYKI